MNKAIIPMLSALFLLSLGSHPVQASVVYHFMADGPSAFFSNFASDNSYSYFSVSQGGSPSNPATSIFYYSSTCDYGTGICEGIRADGQIPVQDFNEAGKSATLNTNTASNPSFAAFHWTYNIYTGESSRTPTSLGSINLTWKASNFYSSQSLGIITNTYLNTTWKSVGRTSYSSATVSGTISGNPVAWTDANFGTSFNNDLSMEMQ